MERTQRVALIELVLPLESMVRKASAVLAASVFIALLARVRVFLPFTPVPLTGQTFGVLLVGALLGSRLGTASVLAYLAEGLLGLPVFSGGGGLGWILGPTGGYLIGFTVAAWVVGFLTEQGWDRKVPTAAMAMLLGNAAIYVFGLPWLACFVGLGKVFALGFLPFVPGDLVKIVLASLALPAAWKLVRGKHPSGK